MSLKIVIPQRKIILETMQYIYFRIVKVTFSCIISIKIAYKATKCKDIVNNPL